MGAHLQPSSQVRRDIRGEGREAGGRGLTEQQFGGNQRRRREERRPLKWLERSPFEPEEGTWELAGRHSESRSVFGSQGRERIEGTRSIWKPATQPVQVEELLSAPHKTHQRTSFKSKEMGQQTEEPDWKRNKTYWG
ncbi:uncharacterized protein LOC120831055 isoform X2 [Gasterosteus aculeatus]